MIEAMAGLPVGDIGAFGLVTMFVLLLFSGRVVPRSVLEDVRRDRDDRLAQAIQGSNDWKEAYSQSEVARSMMAAQVEELLEHARTTDAYIRAIATTPPGNRNIDPSYPDQGLQ